MFAGYISSSLKECERERKSNCETLRLDSLFPSTEGPSWPEIFWACGKNKGKFQRFSRNVS